MGSEYGVKEGEHIPGAVVNEVRVAVYCSGEAIGLK